ncbi:DUF883 family protein [Cellvibrio sp. UBA7661]|uniref:DUF883 family protein n=1 Tax=Cellvibrio sp. UBA7661 TaxID=1946311 RepID=UPI002F3564CF
MEITQKSYPLNADAKEGSAHSSNTSSTISNEFRRFLEDIDVLINETSNMTGDDLKRAIMNLNKRVSEAKDSIEHFGESVMSHARKSAESTNEYVHKKPWVVIGAGAAMGLLLGYLLTRKGGDAK